MVGLKLVVRLYKESRAGQEHVDASQLKGHHKVGHRTTVVNWIWVGGSCATAVVQPEIWQSFPTQLQSALSEGLPDLHPHPSSTNQLATANIHAAGTFLYCRCVTAPESKLQDSRQNMVPVGNHSR